MAALSGPEDVYNKFIASRGYDADGDPEAVALFAFALVEKDKFEWISHRRKENAGNSPSEAEILTWYQDKPDGYFREKEIVAINWYMSFARILLRQEIDQEKFVAIKDFC
jgi:hypothetical protein